MYKSIFKKLAEREKGQFYFKDENIALLNGVRSPNVIYKVTFTYKDNHFTIIHRTGTAYVATISCKLSDTIQPIQFEITNITPLQNLFLRKKSRLTIKSGNPNLKYFLSKNENINKLSKIADKDKFSPTITCTCDTFWTIVTTYHLEFDNWTEPIEPIIELYKNLIDEFEKRIANISAKAYREMN